jgi:DivIVA domain-containing protein
MDLTPQVINEVEFSMARKGYDPEQVDDFLEKLAVGVQAMHEQVAELRQRLVVAERRANEAERRAAEQPERVVDAPAPAAAAAPSSVAGVSAAAEAELETLKRTLLLAQRTADAAVREAEDEARRIVAAAEADARSAHESTRRRVLEEIASLEGTREQLQADLELLDRRADAQRSRLLQTLAELQRIVEETADVPHGASTAAPVEAAPEPAAVAPAHELEAEPLPPAAVEAPVELPPAEPRAAASQFVLAEEEGDDDAWARFGPADEVDAGPRTEPVIRLDRVERSAGPSGDDAYLAELRKAMLDDTGAPDASELGFFDEPDAGRAARQNRFGRRR